MKDKENILKEYEYGKYILGSQAYIAVYRKLIVKIGLINAAILSLLYSYAIFYFSKDTLNDEGYFYKSMNSLQQELQISSHIIRTSLKQLKSLDLIDYKRKDAPPKLYFYINVLKMKEIIIENFKE